ncbi:MAG TPA: phosphatase PAP2 family protein [Streptomyces sp.]|nr:phosphatase PAP2 family protein [Streptomyces sp.]
MVFALITWQVAVAGPLLKVDAQLGAVLRHNSPPADVAELLADLGNLTVALPVLAAATAYAVATGGVRRWLPPLYAVLAMGCVAVIVPLLKVSLGRPGPLGGINYYPSGHTATAAVAFGCAALLLSLTTPRSPRAPYWPLPATAALLTLLCSAGLIWRGYHWPLDVVASWCLGWVLMVSATALVRHGLQLSGRGHTRPGR